MSGDPRRERVARNQINFFALSHGDFVADWLPLPIEVPRDLFSKIRLGSSLSAERCNELRLL